MNSNIKYTTDGRKVAVIGNLNSQEKIVQEIFVSGGSEIPSGEHFVVKSLLDAPAVSWKEKNLKDLELRYDREQKEWSRKIDETEKKLRARSAELSAKLQYIGAALKNANEGSFNTLVDFICGNITHVVVVECYTPKILPIEKFRVMYDNSLRLISLWGRDDGSFTYAIGQYSDYSGGKETFWPFSSYEAALTKTKELLLSATVCEETIALAKTYGVTLDAVKVAGFKATSIDRLNINIAQYEANIKVWKDKIDTISGLNQSK